MTMPTAAELTAMVEPTRVHQRLYTDPAIFDLEMERIFAKTWVFAGHESQLPEPGDYIRVRLGAKDVIVARTDDGGLAGFLNRCAHRGAAVVGTARGHVNRFECPYHGWAYARDGKLVGVPLPQGYPESFDVEDPRWSLPRVAQVESYRGFIFARFTNEGPSLRTYLEPVRDSLDNMVDRSPDGKLVQAGGVFQQVYNGNWKVHIENTFDGIHAGFLHRSGWLIVKEWEKTHGGDAEKANSDQMLQMIKANGQPLPQWDETEMRVLPYGHATMGGFYRDPKIRPERNDPTFQGYRKLMEARYGADQTAQILALDRFNSLIYPNLIVNIRFQQIRLFEPLAADRTILRAFTFRPVGAPEGIFHQNVRFLTSLNSPSSMISQDDHDLFGRMQKAMAAGGFAADGSDEWIDFSRKLGAERRVSPTVQSVGGTSELMQRATWHAWLGYMAGTAPGGLRLAS